MPESEKYPGGAPGEECRRKSIENLYPPREDIERGVNFSD